MVQCKSRHHPSAYTRYRKQNHIITTIKLRVCSENIHFKLVHVSEVYHRIHRKFLIIALMTSHLGCSFFLFSLLSSFLQCVVLHSHIHSLFSNSRFGCDLHFSASQCVKLCTIVHNFLQIISTTRCAVVNNSGRRLNPAADIFQRPLHNFGIHERSYVLHIMC